MIIYILFKQQNNLITGLVTPKSVVLVSFCNNLLVVYFLSRTRDEPAHLLVITTALRREGQAPLPYTTWFTLVKLATTYNK